MARLGRVELRHLRTFVAIAELLNFSRAAERLHLTQPALSRQMRDLEEELGRTLFDRINTGVRLTVAGRQVLTGARRVLAASDALLASARGKPGRVDAPLRIAHFGTLAAQYISPFLRRMQKRQPTVHMEVAEEVPSVALREVKSGRLDAAFIGVPEAELVRSLESRVVWISAQDILLPATHQLAKRRRVSLGELRNERWCIWDEKEFPGFGRQAVHLCRRAGFRTKVVATANSLASLFIHVAGGDYISYAPPFARQLPHPGVVFVPTDPPNAMDIPVQLVWRADSPHHEILRWLAATMAATIDRTAAAT